MTKAQVIRWFEGWGTDMAGALDWDQPVSWQVYGRRGDWLWVVEPREFWLAIYPAPPGAAFSHAGVPADAASALLLALYQGEGGRVPWEA